MKISHIPEPELEFGLDRHIDIRFGIMNYGPVDYAVPLAPRDIRVGIVGTSETVEGVCTWLARCQEEIPAKDSGQPNLFVRFPGFRPDAGFQSTIIMDDRLQRTVTQRAMQILEDAESADAISVAVGIFYSELRYLAENTSAQVLICAVPQLLVDMAGRRGGQSAEAEDASDEGGSLDFHDLLKVKAMDLNIPVQLIIPSTYGGASGARHAVQPSWRRLQDEATRAWNLHTALYYKAKGTPWRLVRNATDLSTCYVGVSFYEALDRESLQTSVAQIFNERGEGVVVRGGTAQVSRQDRQVHLDAASSNQLLSDALATYRKEHRHFPARVVVHKTSTFSDAEVEGFTSAASTHGIDMADLVSIGQTTTRLFRVGSYPPLRGTFLSLDARRQLLYTRGSVDFFATYPGMYVPAPLLFRCDCCEQTPGFLAEEILALTKMNWNKTQFDGRNPITITAARQVSRILKCSDPQTAIASSYRFYM